MKITKISVKKLFDIFDHEIPLNTEERITIIHGPNGYGKTILLTMLNSLFNAQYHRLFSVPFSLLIVFFEDGSRLELKKGDTLTAEYIKKTGKAAKPIYSIKPINTENPPFPLVVLESIINGLTRMDDGAWYYEPANEILALDEVQVRFADQFSWNNLKWETAPQWFKELKDSISINFIETQRLLSLPRKEPEGSFFARKIKQIASSSPMVPTIDEYSRQLSEAIQKKFAEFGTLSQSLDRTFPTRLVKMKTTETTDNYTIEELNSALKQLEEKRERLISAGILDSKGEADFKDLQEIDQSNINVLLFYINDITQKLAVFDELTDKIELLINIINSRFLLKKMKIDKNKAFIFETSEGKKLPPINLSSGEQHELILLYELLFKIKKDSLILIDEPEISLHVAWQQQFIKDLQKVTKLVGFDVLIATHSPQLIHDRWDLTVELKGPNQ